MYDDMIQRLRYGVIGVNHWVGVAFALMGIPWGGYPGQPLEDIQSGRGWVHNAYRLDGVEKSVLEGPSTVFPKPIWLPSHRRPEPVAWRLFDYYAKPSIARLGKLLCEALLSR